MDRKKITPASQPKISSKAPSSKKPSDSAKVTSGSPKQPFTPSFEQIMQDISKDYEIWDRANQQMPNDINSINAQILEMEKILVSMKEIRFLGTPPHLD